MKSKVEAVNKLLLAGEPGNISTDEHLGYTGYRPQAIIDAMNEVFWGEWGFSEVGSEIMPGDKGGLAVAQVQVWLAGIEFKPTSWGQNRVTRGDIGDARKGAQTDAIKKALSYFSIGNRAYQGLLKDDSKGKNEHSGQNNNRTKPASPPATEKPDSLVGKDKAISLFNHAYKYGIIASIHKWQEFKSEKLGRMIPDEQVTLAQYNILVEELAKRKEAAKKVPAEIAS